MEGACRKVLVVDDHPVVLEGYRAAFERSRRLELVGSATTGSGALAAVEALDPQLVLMDVRLGDESGIEVCRKITDRHPDLVVIIVSGYTHPDLVADARSAGARAYVSKRAGLDQLGEVMMEVMGVEFLGPDSQRRDFPVDLTVRERSIMRLLGEGATNRAIAAQLGLSEKTVKNLVSAILAKLGKDHRAEVAAMVGRWSAFSDPASIPESWRRELGLRDSVLVPVGSLLH